MLEHDLTARGITDAAVLAAMARLPREQFVPRSVQPLAYADSPLAIGCGQTISQPYVVAFMTQALEIRPGHKVLEIGTGSGYQTCLLAALGAEVYTIERHEDLSYMAEQVIDRLGYGDQVTMRVDDGTLGWDEEAPFDRIIVTAAGPCVPPALADQLADAGRIIIPVGAERGAQELLLGQKKEGQLVLQPLLDVQFVPLVGAQGFGRPDVRHPKEVEVLARQQERQKK